MISADLAKRAAKQQRSSERVTSWRLRDSTWSFIGYLYWRNRYPVLNKLLVRAFLLLEFYLLFMLFQSRVAVSFSLLFFCFFVARSTFFGVSQYFRVELVQAEKNGRRPQVEQLQSALLVASIIYGLTVGALPFLYFILKGSSTLQLFYSGLWILLLPLELSASCVWLAVYTKQRLRRNIWLICLFRFLPTLILLLFHNVLGPLAYIVGVGLGRTAEKVYLLRLGLGTLERRGTKPAPARLGLRVLRRSFSKKLFWIYSLAPQPLQIYSLSLALMLAARDSRLWLTHFAFTFLVLSLAYVPLRVSMSLFMDLFLSLKFGDLLQAKIWQRRGHAAQNIVLALLTVLLVLLLAQRYAGFGLLSSIAFELSLYFLLALIARTLFLGAWNFQRAAAVEHFFTAQLAILFSLLGLLQAVFVFYLRANLQAIYLLEIGFLFAAALIISGSRNFSKSPFYMEDFIEGLKKAKLLPPFLWLQAVQYLRPKKISCSLITFQLDSRYTSRVRQERLLEEVLRQEPFSGYGTRLAESLYLYILPSQDYPQAQRIAARLIRSYGGHLRNIVALDVKEHITRSILQVIATSSHVRLAPRRLRGLQYELRYLIKSKLFYKVEKRVAEHDFNPFNLSAVLSFIEVFLKENSFTDLPRVAFDGERRIQSGNPGVELLQFAAFSFGSFYGSRALLPISKRPFAVFSVGGQSLLIVDTEQLIETQTKKLYDLVRIVSICLTLQAVKLGSPEQELPKAVRELLRGQA